MQETSIYYSDFNIDDGILIFYLCGETRRYENENKLSITMNFKADKEERIYPLDITFKSYKDKFVFFSSNKISLSHIFYNEIKTKGVLVNIECRIGTRYIDFKGLDFRIQENEFIKKEKKEDKYYKTYKVLASLLCIINLPFFLLDGLIASKGYKKMEAKEEDKKNRLKSIFVHANNITKSLSGFTYSIRENKIKILNKYYEGYKKLPLIKNQILLLSERRLEENSNLNIIRKELKKDPNLIVKEFISTKTIDKLQRKEIKSLAKGLATTKLIIIEDFYPQLHFLKIKEQSSIIQLWHACGAFKSFGFSRLNKNGGVDETSSNHRNYSYVCVSSEKMKKIYSEAFAISTNKVLDIGIPRTDIFFDNTYKQQIKDELYKKYSQIKNKKVILYAPTFRGHGNKDAFFPVEKAPIDKWLDKLTSDYIILLKNHPFVKDKFTYDKRNENHVIDVYGEDINKLLFITDVLITDYSSIIFEAALLNIDIIFYLFDKNEYLKDRDIYYDIESFAIGEIVEDEKDIVATILNPNKKTIKKDEFYNVFLKALDGNSTKRVVELINNIIK